MAHDLPVLPAMPVRSGDDTSLPLCHDVETRAFEASRDAARSWASVSARRSPGVWEGAMKFGIEVRPMAGSLDVCRVHRYIGARGFESTVRPEPTHIPVRPDPSQPGDEAWLHHCKHLLDPFVTLAAVAASTEQLRLGTGVCLLPEHDPIELAKT